MKTISFKTFLIFLIFLVLGFQNSESADKFISDNFKTTTTVLMLLNNKALSENPPNETASIIFMNAFQQMKKYGKVENSTDDYFEKSIIKLGSLMPNLQIGVGVSPSKPGTIHHKKLEQYLALEKATGISFEEVKILAKFKKQGLEYDVELLKFLQNLNENDFDLKSLNEKMEDTNYNGKDLYVLPENLNDIEFNLELNKVQLQKLRESTVKLNK